VHGYCLLYLFLSDFKTAETVEGFAEVLDADEIRVVNVERLEERPEKFVREHLLA